MSIHRRMDKDVVHTYSGLLLSPKKDGIMLFVATWMQLEIIILSKSDKYKCHMISLICRF